MYSYLDIAYCIHTLNWTLKLIKNLLKNEKCGIVGSHGRADKAENVLKSYKENGDENLIIKEQFTIICNPRLLKNILLKINDACYNI